MLAHVPRQLRAWLIFDVRQKEIFGDQPSRKRAPQTEMKMELEPSKPRESRGGGAGVRARKKAKVFASRAGAAGLRFEVKARGVFAERWPRSLASESRIVEIAARSPAITTT